jgi:2-dehydro-3-deoxyphosphogluconate aldolase/(4S)-4-hydroxy-2-oxoglutarate aldolase
MAKHNRLQTLTRIKQLGLVPIFYNPDIEVAKSIVKVCYAAGGTVAEFTNRGDRAIEVFKELTILRDTELPEMILGVGSIADGPTAAMYIAAGTDFVVSAMLDESVAAVCNARKIPYMPGCGTVTEIHNAHKLGVEIVKFFPADCLGGPAFIKAVRAPMPWTEIIGMGGIAPTAESIGPWFKAGAAAIGMSSKLFTKEWLASGDYAAMKNRIKSVLEVIQATRI